MFKNPDKPVRVQRSRRQKQVSPNGLPIVYIGRPGKYGNPNRIGAINKNGQIATREEVIDQYISFTYERLKIDPHWLDDLKGKNLSCWCSPDEKCHADFLLRIANQN